MEPRKEKISITATLGARWALAGGLALWTAVGFTPLARPDALPASAPGGEFSAERAMVTVRAIAQRPHPVGSADHDRVRDYVLGEFARLGLTPATQAGTGSFSRYKGKAENIVARLPGSANTRPVMLAAHYDSTKRGPGAGDDAHGVAVLLETLRALRQSTPLRNDCIFLVTDGEEDGMLGAALFMRDHPWHSEPGVVLNFEARGTGGAATMFETSTPNAWLIRALQTAVPAANATSFAFEVYRRMPNNTDLSVFKHSLAGMNFAFIEHPEWYHRPQDDPAHLDRRSVQEQGTYALALARQFGAQDLGAPGFTQPHSGDAVYFPTRLTPLVVYSTAWVQPLAWLTAAALVAAALAGWRRRVRGFWLAFVFAIPAILQLLVVKAAPGATYLLEWPLAGAVIAYAVWMTAPPVIGLGWRLLVLLLTPAAPLLPIAPMLHTLIVALGPRDGGIIVAVAVLWILIAVSPQLKLVT